MANFTFLANFRFLTLYAMVLPDYKCGVLNIVHLKATCRESMISVLYGVITS